MLDSLSDKQLRFLNEFIKDPTAPKTAINKSTGITYATQKKYLETFKSSGIIPSAELKTDKYFGPRLRYPYFCIFNYQKLQLQTYFVQIDLDQYFPGKSEPSITKLLDLPYLVAILISDIPGTRIYLRFEIPDGQSKNLDEIFQSWSEQEKISSYTLNKYQNHIYQNFNLMSYSGSMKWYEVWKPKLSSRLGTKIKNVQNFDIFEFDEIDLSLIRELQYNPTPAQNFLAEEYDLDISTISRRISRIKSELGIEFHLNLNLGINNIQIFTIHGTSIPQSIEAIIDMIERNEFWFSSSFFSNGENFIWVIGCDYRSFQSLKQLVSDFATIQFCDIVTSEAMSIFLDINQFDKERNSWKEIDPFKFRL